MSAQKSLLNFITINIIAAISWMPPLISQPFVQDFEGRTLVIQLGYFCMDFTSLCILTLQSHP